MGPYSASKHALEAMSDALRMELRCWGIHVSLVVPGQVQTPIWKKSLSAADTLANCVPAESLAMYRDDLEIVRAKTDEFARKAEPADKVVRAVVHALSSRRPKTRYYCNWWTRLLFKAFRMVPDRLRDRIVVAAVGLSARGAAD
jgi:short-subunit dehydrogenase